MHTPELAHLLDKYYQGNNLAGRERIKLFNLVWDSMYSEFAGRHGLYERNYAGNKDQQRLDTLRWAKIRGEADRYRALVEDCLADYDENGWVTPYLK